MLRMNQFRTRVHEIESSGTVGAFGVPIGKPQLAGEGGLLVTGHTRYSNTIRQESKSMGHTKISSTRPNLGKQSHWNFKKPAELFVPLACFEIKQKCS